MEERMPGQEVGGVVAFVPMRHESARVPGKNYRLLDGVPLYHHIVRTLLDVRQVELIVIDTDSPFILEDAADHFGDRVALIERAEHLLGEFASISEILLYDAQTVGATGTCLHTHSTNPLLRAGTIERGIDAFLETRPEHDSLLAVTPRHVRFYWPDGRPINHDPDNLVRTQDLPPVYEENSCLYVFDRTLLERRHNRIGHRPLFFPISGDETADIDDEDGWRLVEALYASRRPGTD
jgi:CMP-N-acetylneuraminic acid synthetase